MQITIENFIAIITLRITELESKLEAALEGKASQRTINSIEQILNYNKYLWGLTK